MKRSREAGEKEKALKSSDFKAFFSLWLPVPGKLKAVLEQLHDRAEKEEELPEGKASDAERE